ncbi:MAG: Hsp70 family protein [Deltaproteobacteria bacterium]|nr:Hsp70 family protein [Deltaproteobacteria bacterium]
MEPVIGIDLGTTNSVVATVRNNRVEVIPDPQGHRLHPSVVAFVPNGDILVGHAGRARRHIDPQNTIYSAKRLIGQSIRNPIVQLALGALPYRVEEGPNEQALVSVRGRNYAIPEISAYVLMHLKQCAEKHLGSTVSKAVITVPANFTDSQRQATKHAGELAGLKVLRILNEPTAAALAYGFGKALDARVAIYDLGGGTFDVTVLQIRDKIFEVLATGGDSFLGGDDFDRTLVDELAARFLEQNRIDLRAHPDGFAKLTIAAEQIKCQLSKETSVAGTIHDLAIGESGTPLSLEFELARARYEAMVSPFVERSLLACEEVLTAANLSADVLTDLILVGGSTRTPMIRRRIVEHFVREPQTRINPDETVAYGAALQAAALTAGAHNPAEFYSLLLDVAPRTLGIAVAGGYAEPIVEKNMPIPIERTRSFVTSHDNQTTVNIQVCQGESRRFAENELLGTLTLDGIPARSRGEAEIEVTFVIDTDGILNVRARDVTTSMATSARIQVLGAPEPAENAQVQKPGSAQLPAARA